MLDANLAAQLKTHLEKVTNPVAVDPDPTLERQSRDRGWPILRLRA